jgi:hypothetical protein
MVVGFEGGVSDADSDNEPGFAPGQQPTPVVYQ